MPATITKFIIVIIIILMRLGIEGVGINNPNLYEAKPVRNDIYCHNEPGILFQNTTKTAESIVLTWWEG